MDEQPPAPKGKECQIWEPNVLFGGLSLCGEDAVANLPIVVFENTPNPNKMGPRMGFVATDVCAEHLHGLKIDKGDSRADAEDEQRG